MPALHQHSSHSVIAPRARWLIGTGLAIQLAAVWLPAAPVVTGMGLVALGATLEVLARFKRAPLLPVTAAGNLFVYLGLYLVFVTAICHAAMTGPQNRLTFFQGLDLGLSIVPMATMVRVSLRALVRREDATAR